MSDALSLTSLFASSFLSATLLPGNSEVVLVAMLLAGVSHPWWLVLIATIGNSLGGVTNVILGRLFQLRKTSRWQERQAHLSSIIKQTTGKTCIEIITSMVIMDAKAQLKSTNLSIHDIAYTLHFTNMSFFGKYFKRYVGMSPQEYRNS